jgi:hypothetical protein
MARTPGQLAAALRRNLAFWRGEPTDRPLAGVYLGDYEVPDVYLAAQDGDLLRPEHILPERFFGRFAARCEIGERLGQDLIPPLSPLYCVPWLEAILGCPIRVGAEACWAEPLLPSGAPLELLETRWSLAWQEAAIGFIRALAESSSGRFPVAGPFLRGPADVVAALLGTERLCFEFHDHPQQIHRLARLCAEAWVEAARLIYKHIPPYHDGYVDAGRWLYAPGPSAYSSEDATALLSARVYREFFLPYNQVIVDTFPYGYIHRHSASVQNLAALLDLRTSWAIEVTMDPNGPGLAEMLPIFQQIQEHGRPLIVFGLDDEAEVATLVSVLSPRGLCVFPQADTEEQARALLAAARGERKAGS